MAAAGRAVAEVTRVEENGAVAPATTRYLHADRLGSTRLVTDEAGAVVETRTYRAFGEPEGAFGGGVTAGFTGHRHDAELGLIDMRGRLYDPRLGRFLTADPFVTRPLEAGGWNRYSYVGNDPLNFVDPSGFQGAPTMDESGGGSSGGAGGWLPGGTPSGSYGPMEGAYSDWDTPHFSYDPQSGGYVLKSAWQPPQASGGAPTGASPAAPANEAAKSPDTSPPVAPEARTMCIDSEIEFDAAGHTQAGPSEPQPAFTGPTMSDVPSGGGPTVAPDIPPMGGAPAAPLVALAPGTFQLPRPTLLPLPSPARPPTVAPGGAAAPWLGMVLAGLLARSDNPQPEPSTTGDAPPPGEDPARPYFHYSAGGFGGAWIWPQTHFTDLPGLSASEAVDLLGVRSDVDWVVVVMDRTGYNIVPFNPPIVPRHSRGGGQGSDYYNPRRLPITDAVAEYPVTP